MRGAWWFCAAFLSDVLILAHLLGPARMATLPALRWGIAVSALAAASEPLWRRRRGPRAAVCVLLALIAVWVELVSDGTALSLWALLALGIRPDGPQPGRWSAVALFWGLGMVLRLLFLPAPLLGAGSWAFWFYPLDVGLGCLGLLAWVARWSPMALRPGRLQSAPGPR